MSCSWNYRLVKFRDELLLCSFLPAQHLFKTCVRSSLKFQYSFPRVFTSRFAPKPSRFYMMQTSDIHTGGPQPGLCTTENIHPCANILIYSYSYLKYVWREGVTNHIFQLPQASLSTSLEKPNPPPSL